MCCVLGILQILQFIILLGIIQLTVISYFGLKICSKFVKNVILFVLAIFGAIEFPHSNFYLNVCHILIYMLINKNVYISKFDFYR